MQKITGILFDKDGTLFDFRTTWGAWAAGFLNEISGADPEVADQLAKAIGFNRENQEFLADSVAIAGTPGDIASALLPFIPTKNASELITMMNEAATNIPMVEATALGPLFEVLKQQGFRIGLATNDAEAPARAHLQSANITQYFDFIAGFDSGYGAKPSPGMLTAFASQFNLNPAEVLMVGDSLHDLNAAQAAGMRPVGVLTGMAQAEDLAPYAEVVLPDIGHLPEWLGL